MSEATLHSPLPAVERDARVTLPRVIRSEWTKLVSLRSTRWSLFVAVLICIGLPILISVVTELRWAQMDAQERARRNPLDIAQVGVNLSQLAIGVLGVLVITGEYATGMIRASFMAVPKRLPVLWAKTIVFAVVTAVLMFPCALIAFFASQAILNQKHILQLSFTAPGVTRTVLAGGLYLMMIGVFALGLGAILRNTAGAIATFAGLLFVLPPLLNVLPTSWQNDISPYLPSSAGQAMMNLTHDSTSLAPFPGFLLFCGYLIGTFAVAAVLLLRRDT